MRQLMLLLIVFLAACGAPASAPPAVSEDEVDRAIGQVSLFVAIMQIDPERGAEIRERLVRAGATSNEALQLEARELGRDMTEHALGLFSQIIRFVPDETVLLYLESMIALMEDALSLGSEKCHALMMGGIQTSGLQPATMLQMMDLLAQIITAGAENDPHLILEGQQLTISLETARRNAHQLAGDIPIDFDLLDSFETIQDDDMKEQACQSVLYFYKGILALPPSDAAAVIRALISDP